MIAITVDGQRDRAKIYTLSSNQHTKIMCDRTGAFTLDR